MADKNTETGVNVSAKTQLMSTVSSELTDDLSGKTNKEIIASMWGIDAGTASEITNMNRIHSSTHGMFRAVPIVCQGNDCAYKEVCMVKKKSRKVGQRCPMEISAILSRFDQWCAHFNIKIIDDCIDPKDLVDTTLIKDLVTVEIQQLRAENKIALNGDFMSKTLLDIDKKCTPYYGEIISPETEFLITLQNRKEKILNQLNATRKDKAQDKRRETPSDEAMKLFQQIREMEKQDTQDGSISDVEFDEDGNIIVNQPVEEEPLTEEDGQNVGN